MYMFKENAVVMIDGRKINQTIASEKIGITQPTLSNILLRKVACRKVVAYCITKYIDQNAEIEDYFEKIQ